MVITTTRSNTGIISRRVHFGISLMVVTLLFNLTTVSAHETICECPAGHVSSANQSSPFKCAAWISEMLPSTKVVSNTEAIEPSPGRTVTNTESAHRTATIRNAETIHSLKTINDTSTIIDTVMTSHGTSNFIPRPTPTSSMPTGTLTRGSNQTPVPVNTNTVNVKCYNLPYGVFGFIGHAVFLYSTAMIGLGKKPTAPLDEPIKGHYLYNAGIGLVHSAGIGTLVAINIANCEAGWSPSWQLGLLGVWQLLETGIYIAVLLDRIRTRRDEVQRSELHEAFLWTRNKRPFLWFTLTHALAAIPGFVALIFLIRRVWGQHNPSLIAMTSLFYGFFALGLFTFCVVMSGRIFNVYPHVHVEDPMERCWDVFFSAFLLLLMVFAVSGLLYSDIALHMVLRAGKRDYKEEIAYGMAFVCWILPLFTY